MKVPKDINIHAINDYLNQHPELSAHEFRVAYYTIHKDYGRKKRGLFWEGAKSIEGKIGIDRRVVQKTWKKMQALGWLTHTGKKVGRASVWRVEYGRLFEEAKAFKEDEHGMDNLPPVISEMLSISCQEVDHSMQEGCALDDPQVAHGMSTNTPNESSQKNPLNEDARIASSECKFCGEADCDQICIYETAPRRKEAQCQY
jgi:hypothetical protein